MKQRLLIAAVVVAAAAAIVGTFSPSYALHITNSRGVPDSLDVSTSGDSYIYRMYTKLLDDLATILTATEDYDAIDVQRAWVDSLSGTVVMDTMAGTMVVTGNITQGAGKRITAACIAPDTIRGNWVTVLGNRPVIRAAAIDTIRNNTVFPAGFRPAPACIAPDTIRGNPVMDTIVGNVVFPAGSRPAPACIAPDTIRGNPVIDTLVGSWTTTNGDRPTLKYAKIDTLRVGVAGSLIDSILIDTAGTDSLVLKMGTVHVKIGIGRTY